MPETNFRLPRFTYSASGPFTLNKERIQTFKEKGDLWYIYPTELDKFCFQYHIADGDLTSLTTITTSDKILRDKAFKIPKNPKHDAHQRFASIVFKPFDKKHLVRNLKWNYV